MKISHIVKALTGTRHPLVRDNMPHNELLHNIINILLVDLERRRVGGSGEEDKLCCKGWLNARNSVAVNYFLNKNVIISPPPRLFVEFG